MFFFLFTLLRNTTLVITWFRCQIYLGDFYFIYILYSRINKNIASNILSKLYGILNYLSQSVYVIIGVYLCL